VRFGLQCRYRTLFLFALVAYFIKFWPFYLPFQCLSVIKKLLRRINIQSRLVVNSSSKLAYYRRPNLFPPKYSNLFIIFVITTLYLHWVWKTRVISIIISLRGWFCLPLIYTPCLLRVSESVLPTPNIKFIFLSYVSLYVRNVYLFMSASLYSRYCKVSNNSS
jgi:hypothetical protein